jgi:hypothetical protein
MFTRALAYTNAACAGIAGRALGKRAPLADGLPLRAIAPTVVEITAYCALPDVTIVALDSAANAAWGSRPPALARQLFGCTLPPYRFQWHLRPRFPAVPKTPPSTSATVAVPRPLAVADTVRANNAALTFVSPLWLSIEHSGLNSWSRSARLQAAAARLSEALARPC